MNREDLKKMVGIFLETFGYMGKSTNVKNGFLFSRPTGLGISDELLVYFHEFGEESMIKSTLTQLSDSYGRVSGGEKGRRFFLSSSPIGKAPPILKEYDFIYQVPVWFFDREFSSEKRLSPLKKLEKDAARYGEERIKQPFTSNKTKSADLLRHLLKELDSPEEPLLRIVVAPAGYGKTVLMGSLYTKLKERFMENKSKQQYGKRPLLMLPGHLKRTSDLDSLINNFIGEEYDYGVTNSEAFRFWVKNSLAIWLIDGLEELILKIPEEFIFRLLEEYIFTSNSLAPQIIVTIRKPLLVTSPDLMRTIEEWEGTGLKVYNLSHWEKEEQKEYFNKNLKLNREEIRSFITDINTSDTLRNICRVPYYCDLIKDLKNGNNMGHFADECDLVDHAVTKLCEREFDKGLDLEAMPVSSQIALFSDLAEESFRGNNISKLLLKDYIDIYLDKLEPTLKDNQLACLLRHALLTPIGDRLDFMQDIIKQYFVSICLLKYLKSTKLDIFDINKIEKDSLTTKHIIKNAHKVDWDKIMKLEIHKLPSLWYEASTGFRNILELFLATDVIEKENLLNGMLENKNLLGLSFKDLNLSSFSFRFSNLSDVSFINCDLSNANFDVCHLKNTSFLSNCELIGATTRGTVTDIIKTDTKTIDNKKEIDKYFYDQTKIPIKQKAPCQAVINLKKVLNKLIRRGRGYKIQKRFLLFTKCSGGIPAEKCIKACIDNQIISESGDQLKIRMDMFNEIELFLKEQELSSSVKNVLDKLCTNIDIGCKHIHRNF